MSLRDWKRIGEELFLTRYFRSLKAYSLLLMVGKLFCLILLVFRLCSGHYSVAYALYISTS
jgi:hypothetical protein